MQLPDCISTFVECILRFVICGVGDSFEFSPTLSAFGTETVGHSILSLVFFHIRRVWESFGSQVHGKSWFVRLEVFLTPS